MGFCGEDKKYTDTPQWFDPLGPNKAGQQAPTGGPEQRAGIFQRMGQVTPQVSANQQQLVAGLQSAAKDPGFAAGADLARKTQAGGFLGGTPEFNNALAKFQAGTGKAASAIKQGALASSVDATADMRSRFGRVGQGFSTANQQASESARAAGAARANEAATGVTQGANQFEAAARASNYAAERDKQNMSGTQLQQAVGQPLEYLNQVPSALYSPLANQAQLVQGLSGGGPVALPQSNIVRQPGIYDYALGTMGATGY